MIPELISAFNIHNVRTAAFVGSATAYIPSKVSFGSELGACTLVDLDSERMKFSEGIEICSEKVIRICSTFEACQLTHLQDAVVISNTLLEFELMQEFVDKVRASLVPTGQLFVFMPDVLEDIVQAHSAGDQEALENFINGYHQLVKRDKFTLTEYNFFAHRHITLIQKFLATGFVLKVLKVSSTRPKYVMLHFEAING